MKLIGIDLHHDTIVAAILDFTETEPEVRITKYLLQTEAFRDFLSVLSPEDVVIVESTTNAFWFYRTVKPRVQECYVLNTNAVHLRGTKTDQLDAKKLLQVLCTFVLTKTENELPSVYVPTESVLKLRSLFASYRLFSKMNAQCRNRIHSIYAQNGQVIEKRQLAKAEFRTNLLTQFPLADYWREQVALLLEELESVIAKREQLKKNIVHFALELFHDEIEILITIPGVSPFTAAAFMSDVCDVSRFASAKKLCAYLKTAPHIKASNKTEHLGPVSKAGRSLTVTLLTQSMPHLKVASPAYKNFYDRLREGKSVGKCRIALIRKTITSAYYMLKRHKEFSAANPQKTNRKHHDLTVLLRGYKGPRQEIA